MVKPVRTLLLLFYVMCLSFVIMVISPKEINLGENMTLNVFTLDDLYPVKTQETPKANITEVLDLQKQLDSINNIKTIEAQKKEGTKKDTTKQQKFEKKEFVKPTKYVIQYPDESSFALDNFFDALYQIPDKEQLIRILHYGDSQVEGDRVSSYLRKRLQKRFGGCGTGILPLVEKQASRFTVTVENASNLGKFSLMDSPPKIRTDKYGVLGSFFMFTPQKINDSTKQEEPFQTWVRYRKTSYILADDPISRFENIKVLFKTQKKINVKTEIDKDTVLQNEIWATEGLSIFEEPFKAEYDKITIRLTTEGTPNIYGVAFDCNKGITLDNIALRGSSVVEFSRMNREMLQSQLEKLKVKLVILEFGVNVIPNPVKHYGFYEEMMYKQLRYLRSVMPEVNILVVGVSDMARRSGTGYASYPNVTLVRDAQKKAAFRAGCAFWDLYEAMGGENSMVAWVSAKPSLANKDYTHFSHKGAEVVGEMLYHALIQEYDNYKKRKNLEEDEATSLR